MKTDIRDRQDIQLLVDSFYDKVRRDTLIGPIFNDVAQVDWQHHLPLLYDFWDNVLFASGAYKNNPMAVHLQLNKLFPLDAVHFSRWKELFLQTVDEHFEGPVAERARQRALSIATTMQIKVSTSPSAGKQ